MEDSKFQALNSSIDSVMSESDLANQLREKIRLQAHRLRLLEQYRMLCEERIQDLFPGHPLPVSKEHFTSLPSHTFELTLAKEKISRLEHLLSQKSFETDPEKSNSDYNLLLEKYNELLKDKNDLEESLRAEMLNCEEQRIYIDLLRHSIDSNNSNYEGMMIDLRLPLWKNNSNTRSDEGKKMDARAKGTILEYESQIKKLMSLLKNKENENENLIHERKNLDSHLRQAAEALQIAEEEVAKLEDEKISLMEYIDQHTAKEKEMERELNDLSKYFEEMKKDFHDTLSNLETQKNSKEALESDCKSYKVNLEKYESIAKDHKEAYENLKKSITDKENVIKQLKQEKLELEVKVEKLQRNTEKITISLKETQLKLSELQEMLDSTSKQETHKSENLSKLKLENSALTQENFKLKEKMQVLKIELETEKKNRIDIERMRELDIRQLQEFKIKILDLNTKNELSENLKKSRNVFQQLREADSVKIGQLEEDLIYLRECYKELQKKDNLQSEALVSMKNQNNGLKKEIEIIYQENQNLRADLMKKNKELENYFSKFNNLNEYCKRLETDESQFEDSPVIEKNIKNSKNPTVR